MTDLINKGHGIKWLEDRTILLALTGSKAYGTDTEDSDTDIKGICIPPIDYFIGLNTFNEYNSTNGKNFKNNVNDTDVAVMHVSKFVKDAMSGSPGSLELLFNRKEDYLKITGLGKKLIDSRHLFLSKKVYHRYRGYAKSQMNKVLGRGESNFPYTYNTKYFMHSIRLLTSAIEILMTGDFSTYRPNRHLLLDCRNGFYSIDEAIELFSRYDSELTEVFKSSSLPENPDYNKVNELLININKEGLMWEW